jgi:hypothetical protein
MLQSCKLVENELKETGCNLFQDEEKYTRED